MQTKTLEEVEQIQERFCTRYQDGFLSMNSVGIGKDDNGSFCLVAGFESEDGRGDIPSEFEGVKVITVLNGRIQAL